MNKTTFPDDLEDDLFLDDPFVEDTIHSPNLIPETGDTTKTGICVPWGDEQKLSQGTFKTKGTTNAQVRGYHLLSSTG